MARAMMRKRKGFSLTELLIAMPLVVLLAGGALSVMSLSLKTFEKHAFYAAHPGWQSAERFFALIDSHIRHCGLGLPVVWDRSLFSDLPVMSQRPAWADWGEPLSVGRTNAGNGFASTGSEPGNTLRLVSAAAPGVTLLKGFSASAGDTVQAELSSPVKSEANVSPVSSASWLVAPGWQVPMRLVSAADQATPTLAFRQDAALPVGTRICRLSALTMWENNGVVFVDFHDESGSQPLFRHIDEVSFCLDTGRRLLRAKVSFGTEGGKKMELERAWNVHL
ncbi:MAG: prepilin-type N-terminal cleavage/methylation domain-containing protein [Pyramidobacter sp.]|nr:prepilin-type N-terminal cleavage/methylation domain-containing protein [Pyramidobacter sp.]